MINSGHNEEQWHTPDKAKAQGKHEQISDPVQPASIWRNRIQQVYVHEIKCQWNRKGYYEQYKNIPVIFFHEGNF
jgi:hypothetical protein